MAKSLFDLLRDELRDIVREHYSIDGKFDDCWESEFPIMDFLLDRVMWLHWRRQYITHEILDTAAELAARRETPDLSKVELDFIVAAYWVRKAVLKDIVEWSGFAKAIDETSPQKIWVPYSKLEHVQSVEYVLWQSDFMILCRNEWRQQIRQSSWNVNMFRLIELERADANEWLLSQSRRIAKNILHEDRPSEGEDALQDWSEKLLSKPFHARQKKLTATYKAISNGIIDKQRKGGKSEHVPLDDTLVDSISDEYQETPDELRKPLAVEAKRRVREKRPLIEAVLSEGVKRNRKQVGKRRFTVWLERDKTSEQIATILDVNEKTIDRDRAVIQGKQDIIQKVIWD